MSKENALEKCHILYDKNDTTKPTGAVVTPCGRFWFLAIDKKFKSQQDKKEGDGAYIVTMCIRPDADLAPLRAIIKDAAKAEFGDKIPANAKSPIRLCKEVFNKDGDNKYPAEMDNWFQITANTYSQQPGITDRNQVNVNKIRADEDTDQWAERLKTECYAGRWGRISVSAKGYNNESKGVKLWLQNVQLLQHDTKLGGRTAGNAEADFGAVAGDDGAPLAAGSSADSVFG